MERDNRPGIIPNVSSVSGSPDGYCETGLNPVSHDTIMDIKRWQLQVTPLGITGIMHHCSLQIHQISAENMDAFMSYSYASSFLCYPHGLPAENADFLPM